MRRCRGLEAVDVNPHSLSVFFAESESEGREKVGRSQKNSNFFPN